MSDLSKITLLLYGSPYPARSGGAIRMFHLVEALRTTAQLQVIAAPVEPEQYSALTEHAASSPDIDWVVLPPAAGGLLSALRRYLLCLVRDEAPALLRISPASRAAIIREIGRWQPDLVVVEYSFWGPLLERIRRAAPRSKVVVDLQNVESDLAAQLAGETRDPLKKLRFLASARAIRASESSTLGRATRLWTCSAADGDHYAELVADCPPVSVLPNPSPVTAPVTEDHTEAGTIAFVGDFAYPPNSRAADWLMRFVKRARESVPQANLLLIGRNPTRRMKRIARRCSFVAVTGEVAVPAEHLSRAEVVLVPLTSGGGTRLKVLEAMASMKPVVATAKAVEGLAVQSGWDLVIAELDEFLVRWQELRGDPDRTSRMVRRAKETAARHDPARFRSRVRELLEELQ